MPIFKTGIEIPPKPFNLRTKGVTKYEWIKDWKVGDCLEVETKNEADRITNATRRIGFDGNGTQGKVVQRAVNENNVDFIRIWRIA